MREQNNRRDMIERIIIRGRVCEAERIYTSSRGDYVVYLYRGKVYRVRTCAS